MTSDLSVGIPGFEPGKTGPESVVLPLHHSSMSHGTTRSTCPPLPVGPKSCDARCDCRSLRFGDAKVAHNFALCKKNPKNFSNFVSARFPAHRKPDDKNRILEHQHDEYKNPPDSDELPPVRRLGGLADLTGGLPRQHAEIRRAANRQLLRHDGNRLAIYAGRHGNHR